jgi:2-oxoglutarate ferredoxin oxidoreductase subunit beta
MDYKTFPKSYKKNSKPHFFCPGCGHAITLKQLGDVVDELGIARKMVFGIDIGCSLLAWNFYDIDTIQTHHGRSVPVVVGIKKVAPKKIAVAYMGDGGAYAIGLQSLIHAAYRNDPIVAVVINNTNYAMTGGQMAPTTFPGEITSTSIFGKRKHGFGNHFLGPEMVSLAADKNSYIARVSVSNPRRIKDALKKAFSTAENGNFAFIEVLSICPTNWKTNAHDSFEFLKTIEAKFPLKEFIKTKEAV